ncbi:MAG: SurA N-terminal domain-containing protein [Pseudomonadaceae bacterium]|nr:SurA N-terminal domain-containing protein [Pseudomonadaceae bacterium]
MLMKLRDKSQSAGSKVLVFIICAVLALFGFGGFDAFSNTDPDVASVGGVDIPQSRVDGETQLEQQRLLSRGDIDPAQIDPLVLRERVLDQLITRTVLEESASELGLAASERQVAEVLQSDPSFQVDGRFDEDTFARTLLGVGYSPARFLDELDGNIKVSQMTQALQRSHFLPDWEFAMNAALLAQRRTVAYIAFRTDELLPEIEISEEQALNYFDDNADRYLTEETLALDVISYGVDDYLAANPVEISEEDVVAAYEADREAAQLSETRRASHILLQVDEDRSEEQASRLLADIKERVAAGADFAELAAEYSQDPGSAASGGDLGFVQRGTFVPEFEEATWALDVGEISDPVVSEFGVHLIRLEEVRQPDYVPLENVREEIIARLTRSRALDALTNDLLPEIDKLAFDEADSLDPIAQMLDLEPVRVAGVSRRSGDGLFQQAPLRDMAFSEEVLDDGYNSRVVEADDGSLVVMRLAERTPAAQRPFDEVREDIISLLARQQAREQVAELADEALAALEADEAAAEIADRFERPWVVVENAARTMPDTPLSVLQTAFRLPVPDDNGKSNAIAPLGLGDLAVVTVTDVIDGDVENLSENEQLSLRSQLLGQLQQGDVASFYFHAESELGVERQ